MRATIEIDTELLQDVMQDGRFPTGEAAVEAGLRLLDQIRQQSAIRELRGKVHWEGDLEQSRLSRFSDWDGSGSKIDP